MENHVSADIGRIIFDVRYPNKWNNRVFRFVYVEPSDDGEFTIHYAVDFHLWSLEGLNTPKEHIIRGALHDSPFSDVVLTTIEQENEFFKSEAPWDQVFKADTDIFPGFLGVRNKDGSVRGWFVENRHLGSPGKHIAEAFPEPEDAEKFIDDLHDTQREHGHFHGLEPKRMIEASSLEEALLTLPETDGGQREVFIYENGEWMDGNYNSDRNQFPGLSLGSIADFYGTRVSSEKKERRGTLDIIRDTILVTGDYDVLLESLYLSLHRGEFELPEDSECLKKLCSWWNANAPEGMREAGIFRLYRWEEEQRSFLSLDPQEPAWDAEGIAKSPCKAIFERNGEPTIVALFMKGTSANEFEDGCTKIFYADGSLFCTIGCPIEEYAEQESWASVKCLEKLSNLFKGKESGDE